MVLVDVAITSKPVTLSKSSLLDLVMCQIRSKLLHINAYLIRPEIDHDSNRFALKLLLGAGVLYKDGLQKPSSFSIPYLPSNFSKGLSR